MASSPVIAAAGIENQFRIVLADQFGKRRRQSEAGMKAELGEIGGEARLRAGDAKIRRHRKPQPAADRSAMDRGDDRLLVAENPHRLDIEMVDRKMRDRIGLFLGLGFLPRRIAEIGAGAEGLALGCEHHARTSESLSIRSSASAIWLISETSKKFSGGRWISIVVDVAGFLDADIREFCS